MRSSLFSGVKQRRLVVKRRFGTTYRPHLQAVQEERRSSWTTWPLKVEPTVCPETSIYYQSTLSNVQKQLRSLLLHVLTDALLTGIPTKTAKIFYGLGFANFAFLV